MFFLFSFDFFCIRAGETISILGFGRDQEGCFATISSVLGCSASIVSTLIGAITLFFCISFFYAVFCQYPNFLFHKFSMG